MADRRKRFALYDQLRLLTPLVIMWGFGLVAIAWAGLQTRIPRTTLFLDPATISGLPWYTGLLSNIGLLAWTIAAAAAAGGAWVARETGRPSASKFLQSGAIVTLTLLLDDMFLVHSDVLPSVFGVPKIAGVALVILPAIAWIIEYFNEVERTRWAVLVASLAALFCSVFVDLVVDPERYSLLLEDGAKFLGVLAWTLYFVLTTRDIARSTVRAAAASGSVTSENGIRERESV